MSARIASAFALAAVLVAGGPRSPGSRPRRGKSCGNRGRGCAAGRCGGGEDRLLHRRLRDPPHVARPEGLVATRRGNGAEDGIWLVLSAEYLARPERRDRVVERGRVRQRRHGGGLARRRASLPGPALHVLFPHVGEGHAGPLRLPAHDAAGRGPRPSNALPFPFSIRRAVGFWKLLYMPKIDPPAVDPTDPEALGRYLVEGPGHCAECHSPRDLFGGIIESRRLTGGPLPDGKGKRPISPRAA